ncbi:MAG TPA: L,D-transpeptidase family protein [Alphaproteobacteria bacterium]|nr:L,D-transpeptidase family protein [Alphaproteobacteria bacterium]
MEALDGYNLDMDVRVVPSGQTVWQGVASWNGQSRPCALGRAGVRREKREGDGATPIGAFPFRRVLYRADRIAKPVTGLSVDPIGEHDGWCDDPRDQRYNTQVRLPYPASHERLWRNDNIYDLIVVLGHNDTPPVPYAGSAIFLHIARDDFSPTEGCVAVRVGDLLRIVAQIGSGDRIVVEAAL